MKSILPSISFILILLLLSSCSTKTNPTEGGEFYKVVYEFSKDSLTGDSEYGLLLRNKKRLMSVLSMSASVWSINTDGTDDKNTELHGISNAEGVTYNIQFGLINAGPKVYGVTQSGGEYGLGTLYTVDPSTNAVKIEYEFDGDELLKPNTLPLYDGDSLLYGLAQSANEDNLAWYTYNIYSKKITSITINQSKRVQNASSAVTYQLGEDDYIYANDMLGQENNLGWIFRIDKTLATDQLVYNFDSINGASPSGKMVFHKGKIYGTATSGGIEDNGLVFSMNTDGSNYKVLAKFDGKNGHLPEGLLLASDGMLYGTCWSGGKTGEGSIFRLNTDGSNFSVFWHFNTKTGYAPAGDLVEDENGMVYGLTRGGGVNDSGVVYSLDIKNIQR